MLATANRRKEEIKSRVLKLGCLRQSKASVLAKDLTLFLESL